MMRHVEELLEKAHECLAMAETTGTEERKSEFKKMAHEWFEIAGERRQSLEESGTTEDVPPPN